MSRKYQNIERLKWIKAKCNAVEVQWKRTHQDSHPCACNLNIPQSYASLKRLRTAADENIRSVWSSEDIPHFNTWNQHKRHISNMFPTLFSTVWSLTAALLIMSSHCILLFFIGVMIPNWTIDAPLVYLNDPTSNICIMILLILNVH